MSIMHRKDFVYYLTHCNGHNRGIVALQSLVCVPWKYFFRTPLGMF